MPLIFISYKRSPKTTTTARELHTQISRYFGVEESVFLDEHAIRDQEDIRDRIREDLLQCEVFLVLIDKRWKECLTDFPYPSDPNRWIGSEIEEVLNSDSIHPFLVLLDDTEMPYERELPEAIRRIVLKKAMRFRRSNFQEDLSRLIRELSRFVKGVTRSIPDANASKHDQYYSEVRYCLEGNSGFPDENPLSEAGRLYLEVLEKHLGMIRKVDQLQMANRAQQPYSLYREVIENSFKSTVRESYTDKISLRGEPLKYLNRLQKIFDIPKWKAEQIKESLKNDWEDKIDRNSDSIKKKLKKIPYWVFRDHKDDAKSVMSLLKICYETIDINDSKDFSKERLEQIIRREVKLRHDAVKACCKVASKLIDQQYQEFQEAYPTISSSPGFDKTCKARLEAKVKERMYKFRQWDIDDDTFDIIEKLKLNVLVKHLQGDELFDQEVDGIIEGAIWHWLRQRKSLG